MVQILEILQAAVTYFLFYSWIDIHEFKPYYSHNFKQCRLHTERPKHTAINLYHFLASTGAKQLGENRNFLREYFFSFILAAYNLLQSEIFEIEMYVYY